VKAALRFGNPPSLNGCGPAKRSGRLLLVSSERRQRAIKDAPLWIEYKPLC
jgi:hypothetical protein